MAERVTFSFGQNWQKYLGEMPASAIAATTEYVRDWLGDLNGRSFVDIGSGSGLLGFVAHELGASPLRTFDVDPLSVDATDRMRDRAERPEGWTNGPGSILDDAFVEQIGRFDVVSSWGVLHHTGNVWHAIENAGRLVAPGGRLWIALYTRTYWSGRSHRTKRLYNRTPDALKPIFRAAWAAPKLAKMAVRRDVGRLRSHDERGMVFWRDVEDWLGGLPYEPVGPGEVLSRLRPRGFVLERLQDALGEGGNDVYLFRLEPNASSVMG